MMLNNSRETAQGAGIKSSYSLLPYGKPISPLKLIMTEMP